MSSLSAPVSSSMSTNDIAVALCSRMFLDSKRKNSTLAVRYMSFCTDFVESKPRTINQVISLHSYKSLSQYVELEDSYILKMLSNPIYLKYINA